MDQWENTIVELDDCGLFGGSSAPTETELDRLGEQGWELATSLGGSHTGLGSRPKDETDALVFKRRAEWPRTALPATPRRSHS